MSEENKYLGVDGTTQLVSRVKGAIGEIGNGSIIRTSASPLQSSTASSIVGIDACGNSTQSGTPTPTNPIAIVDASGDVVAHTINLCNIDNIVLGKSWDATTVNASRGYVEITDVVVGETYTLSAVSLNGLSSISAMPLSGNNLAGSAKTVDANTSSVSFTIASTVDKIRILYVAPSGTLTKAMAEATKTMFCKGTSTDYVEYASNKITLPTLRSVGDVKDELIVNADGSGQIIRRVAEVDLGSFTWVRTSNHFYAKASGFNAKKVGSSAIMDALCASYPIVSTDTVGAETQTFALSLVYTSDYFFGLCDNRTTDATQMKSLLNGVEFVYALATPTTETLTSAQVASIRQLQTYSGTTIVDSALDVKSVTYHADTKQYIDGRTDYSYSDTIIGKWADGKDLHRMVIQTTTPSTTSDTVVSTLVNQTKCDVKTINGCFSTSGGSKLPINYFGMTGYYTSCYVSTNGIQMVASTSAYTSKPCEIIVEYTLKNESAISVLSDDSEEVTNS